MVKDQSLARQIQRRGRWLLTLVAAVEVGTAAYVALFGGFFVMFGPLRVSAGDPVRPFVLGGVSACAAMVLHDGHARDTTWNWVGRWSGALAAAAAIATLAGALLLGATAAGASDMYGYVSQAVLLAGGHVRIAEPLAVIDPAIAAAASPLGYRLSGPDSIAPIYSPGLPLLMVPFYFLGGERGVYYVVPILGAIAVWLTFVLGRRTWDGRVGCLAAASLACSPVFLHQLYLPMSDVPVTALWLAALVWALSDGERAPLLAGLASAVALLIRPNLVPVAAGVAALIWLERRRLSSLAAFGLGLLPAPIAIGVLYSSLYGSAVSSGYGSLATLFRVEWLTSNVADYSRRLVETQSMVMLLAPVALAIRPSARMFALAVFCLLVCACYAFYVPFEGWHYLRFLLPAIPVFLIMTAGVVVWSINRLAEAWRGATYGAVCGMMMITYLPNAQLHGAFHVGKDQRRYLSVGTFLGRHLPTNALVLAGLHSGSVRLYGHRPTLLWTQLASTDLDRSAALLTAKGYALYVLLEPDEERDFRRWFASSSSLGALDWGPEYEYMGHPGARVYALKRDASVTAGAAVPTVIPES